MCNRTSRTATKHLSEHNQLHPQSIANDNDSYYDYQIEDLQLFLRAAQPLTMPNAKGNNSGNSNE